MTGRSIMRLLPRNAEATGEVRVDGQDILSASEAELRHIRGRKVGMIFQDPSSALNPVASVGSLLRGILEHNGVSHGKAAISEALGLLGEVGLPREDDLLRRYPHELSGGMQQRVMIAAALAASPRLLVADEPTTALDATVQAQILNLLISLRDARDLAVLLITHNIAIVEAVCQRVAVIYAGQVVEEGPADAVLATPHHPYSMALLAARPGSGRRKSPLPVIPGSVPSSHSVLSGCPFAPRCPLRMPVCLEKRPPFDPLPADRFVACWARR